MSARKIKPKFRRGQVVSVNDFYGNFCPGETGPGFEGKRGWRHGWQFGKIVKVLRPFPKMKPVFCYFLDGWPSALTEKELRALTSREAR